MSGEERRIAIISELSGATGPISATHLANKFSVTRQIIVADIALLRASGHSIRAEHRGYVLGTAHGEALVKRIVCSHEMADMLDELYAVVDNGGRVLDVTVEHSLYGTLSGQLDIASRYDADQFKHRIEETGASQLSDLTGGLHVHSIAVKDEDCFKRICDRLSELGVLIET